MSIQAIILSILGLSVGMVALLLLCNVVFPNLTARAGDTAERMPIRSFTVGLINFTFFGLLCAALLSGDQGAKVIGLIVGTTLLSFIAVGLAVIARLVGERLRPGQSVVQQVLVGAITLDIAALVPVVGWLVVPVLAGLVGYGATIIALIWRGGASHAVGIESQEPRAEGRET
jgi:hypothetical protein